MMTNKEKFLELVSKEKSNTAEKIEWRVQNRLWLRKSQKIALKILSLLDEKNMSQKDLANLLDVSPQQISKWVKGKENFQLETISRIETALDTTLIHVDDEQGSLAERQFNF